MLVESTESFSAELILVSMDATGVTIDPDTASITITDEDSKSMVGSLWQCTKYFCSLGATIGFGDETYDVIESAGVVSVDVRVSQGDLGRDVIVSLQTDDGTAVCKSRLVGARYYML